ncbi:MAG: hypothetical protein ACKV2T_31490, partial [Kofleriaceae bacterium]
WSYVATWSDGHVQTLPQHDWLDPGESKAGWAHYLVCADDHGRISKVRIDNVRVKDLTLEERAKEAERLALDKKLEDERIAREKKLEDDRIAREKELEDKRVAKKLEDERIAREKELEDDRIAREKKDRETRAKKDQGGAKSTSKSGNGAAVCDAGCQRQQQLSLELERQRQAAEANRQLGEAMGAAAGQVFLAKGGNEAQSWSTRLFALTFGFGMRLAPVMTDTTGAQYNSFSSQDTGGGLSLALGFEYWPLFRKHLGLGFAGGAAGGGLVMPGGLLHELHLEGGTRAYLGNRAGWSVAGELGVMRTSVGASSVLLGAITKGSGSYVTTRFGVGPSWCAIEKDDAPGQCTLSIGAKLLWDSTGLADTTRVYQATIDWHSGFLGRLGIYFELGRGYPAPGTATFALDPEDQDRAGTRIAVMMTKGFTWFSGRVAVSRSSRIADGEESD